MILMASGTSGLWRFAVECSISARAEMVAHQDGEAWCYGHFTHISSPTYLRRSVAGLHGLFTCGPLIVFGANIDHITSGQRL